uniref:Uncharacterized protein n=1 Tax=Eutreptiella gymnastica TaxID=73025 RepID=A0A7S1J2C9_9EUGL|mmetsp:Transcript_60711/g.108295  ORF Transcript_60711/g.108295 Transcript_60711/m.108295 type:complete len:141 (+) Transcript_60711:36-458(+)
MTCMDQVLFSPLHAMVATVHKVHKGEGGVMDAKHGQWKERLGQLLHAEWTIIISVNVMFVNITRGKLRKKWQKQSAHRHTWVVSPYPDARGAMGMHIRTLVVAIYPRAFNIPTGYIIWGWVLVGVRRETLEGLLPSPLPL